jgi:ABC-type transport system substrate-binding protein
MPKPSAGRYVVATVLVLAAALAGGTAALAQQEGRGLTIVLPEEPDIVDPCHASRSNIGRIVKQNVAETLTEIDPATAACGRASPPPGSRSTTRRGASS